MTMFVACFHCAEPVPADVQFIARIGDKREPVCCIGCQAAAEWIAGLGLQDYYRLRDTPATKAKTPERYSAWDRPQLQKLYVRRRVDGLSETSVLVEGMRCAACSWLIERALHDVDGVRDVSVNSAAQRLTLVWDAETVALSALLMRVARLGYVPHPLDADALNAVGQKQERVALKRLVVAGLGMMQSMMYAVALYVGAFDGMNPETRDFFRWIGLLVTTPVVLYAGQPFFFGALREWRARTLSMDTPVAIAIGAVYVASIVETILHGAQVYFDSASMFILLLLAARYIEMHARHRAADVADALARLQPALAQRRGDDGSIETVGVHELNSGDNVIVADGAAIPADGMFTGAQCSVDESLLTGESEPRLKHRGDTLIAGSIARSGPVELRVERIGAETALSSIVRLVTRAQSQRPRWAQLGDRFAARFVVTVILLTVATAGIWMTIDPSRAFAASLAVLVVSCPCAFALSVPTALTRAMALLARSGVLVLKSDALEKCVKIDCIVFDKTGTLTERRLELLSVIPFGRLPSQDCLRIAGQLEIGSSHPYALALRDAAQVGQLVGDMHIDHIAGVGVEGDLYGVRYRLGRAAFAAALSKTDPDGIADGVILADTQGPLARFEFRERLREDAASTVTSLHDDRVCSEILSGDAERAVSVVAKRVGIDVFQARQSPAAKLARLGELRKSGAVVAMVGDGINDAPVLAGADVAIALGDGAQLAQSSADIVLASNRLGALIDARRIAKTTVHVLRQNLVWAFVYNVAMIPLAAMGGVSPWLAAIGMSTSSLFVVLNALRIRLPTEPRRTQRVSVVHGETLVTS